MSRTKVTNAMLTSYPWQPAGPGVPVGGTTGQVLSKASNTDYAFSWLTPATAGITLPLTQNLTFSPDATYDIGTNATTARPRDLFLSRNAAVGGNLTAAGVVTGAGVTATTGNFTVQGAGMGLLFTDTSSRIFSSGRTTYFDEFNGGWNWRNTASGQTTVMSLAGTGGLSLPLDNLTLGTSGKGLASTTNSLSVKFWSVQTVAAPNLSNINPLNSTKPVGLVIFICDNGSSAMYWTIGGANTVQLVPGFFGPWSAIQSDPGKLAFSYWSGGDYYLFQNMTGVATTVRTIVIGL